MSSVAGAHNLSELASSRSGSTEEAAIVAELKAGSEDAFAWLIAHYSQPVYSLVYRMLDDPSDAADTTQEVFIKIFRGIRGFNSNSSLKTWIYRIALHEASNQRRWWFRHRGRETSIEPSDDSHVEQQCALPCGVMLRRREVAARLRLTTRNLRDRVETELRAVAEPYRTTLILRDIEELSYEEIAEVTRRLAGDGEIAADARSRGAAKTAGTPPSGVWCRQSGPGLRKRAPQQRNGRRTER